MKDRKQAEDAVKGSEQRLNLVLDSANMGIWELNLKNDTSIRSLKHDQIFGFQSLQSEWGAEIFLTHVVPEDRNLVKKKFEEAFLTSKLYLECRILWPDKSVHWINALGTAFRDGNGKPVFMMGTVQEITDRKLAEDEIQRTNRELSAQPTKSWKLFPIPFLTICGLRCGVLTASARRCWRIMPISWMRPPWTTSGACAARHAAHGCVDRRILMLNLSA